VGDVFVESPFSTLASFRYMTNSIPRVIKIVHVISGLSTGGAEMMLNRLLSGMDRSRYENVVVSLTGLGTLGGRIEALGVRVYALGRRPESTTHAIGVMDFMYLLLIGLWKLMVLLKRERPHILQTWLYHADLLGLLAGKLARVPAIMWNVRCTESNEHRKVAMCLLAWLSRYPDMLVVNSQAGRRYHESKGYRPKLWVHIPNGFDLEAFRPDSNARASVREELGVSQDTLLVGLIGRDHPLKDIETFLRASSSICSGCRNVHFILVGSGLDQQNARLVEATAQLKLSPYVHLLGRRDDISRVSSSFDIGVLSSCAEGFPNVVGEMMACGVPCVVTDVGDAGFLLGGTGRVVPCKDPGALGKACLEIIAEGSEGRRTLGEKARARIVECFDIRIIVQRYEEMYSSLFSRRAFPS
jgi:glycosyltransferase involved in cell wall biosynthesis